MGRVIGAIAFMALAYTVLLPFATRLGPNYMAGAAWVFGGRQR